MNNATKCICGTTEQMSILQITRLLSVTDCIDDEDTIEEVAKMLIVSDKDIEERIQSVIKTKKNMIESRKQFKLFQYRSENAYLSRCDDVDAQHIEYLTKLNECIRSLKEIAV